MNPEQKRFPISRRALIKGALFGVAAAAGADLTYRHYVIPRKQGDEEAERRRISSDLNKKAETIYPRIPKSGYGPGDNVSADQISRVQQKSVVTSYDKEGNPITFPLLEGEELIKALGYQDQALDEEQPPSVMLRNRDGSAGPLKPDGSRWTLRERILYRPELYNEALRGRIDDENDKKRQGSITSSTNTVYARRDQR